jgi:hypothetical protein
MQRPDFRQMVPSITGMGDEENEQWKNLWNIR